MTDQQGKNQSAITIRTINAEQLIETDSRASHLDTDYFKNLLCSYYRQPLPFDLEIIRHLNDQPADVRLKIKNDPFHQHIGKFLHILDFSEEERISFAHESETNELAVFLLFERDLDVLEIVFESPRLPIKSLMDYINLIKERDIDRQDDKILKLAQLILKRRSRRIIKAREIQTLSQEPIDKDRVTGLLAFLSDDDPYIQSAASNGLSSADWKIISVLLSQTGVITQLRILLTHHRAGAMFQMLDRAVKIVLRSQHSYMVLDQISSEEYRQLEKTLRQSLQNLKLLELEECRHDPTDLFNLSLLVYFHIDADKQLAQKAAEIIDLNDVFDLITDESTPRSVVTDLLSLIEKHADPMVRNRVHELRLHEAERLNKKLKEIEVSVNAYFDVIFQSLGYVKINDRKDAVQVLKTALNFLHQYHVESNQAYTERLGDSDSFLNEAIGYYQNSINKIYLDTKKEIFSEMQQIQSMISHVMDLKEFRFDEEAHTENDTIEEDVLNKATMIWRVSISRYLGRIKDLDEMLHMKFIKIYQETDPKIKLESIEDELHEAIMEIETSHKESVDCKLKIPCRECKRRGCSAERFLLQCDFLLDEIHRLSFISK
jgi:hypothetical protein